MIESGVGSIFVNIQIGIRSDSDVGVSGSSLTVSARGLVCFSI